MTWVMETMLYLMVGQIKEPAVSLLFFNSGKGILIFTNADDGYKVYEKLVIHYLGEEEKIADIENK
jgi:hypothetical protein